MCLCVSERVGTSGSECLRLDFGRRWWKKWLRGSEWFGPDLHVGLPVSSICSTVGGSCELDLIALIGWTKTLSHILILSL